MSRIPETPSPMEAEGIPDTDQDYNVEPPHDAPLLSDEFGTTAAEQREGEPLDGRIAREEPDVIDLVGLEADESAPPVGRLVESDEGARTDTEAEMTASDVGTDLGGYSAEESAMHLEPEV
jgi:hypothetical protein